MVRATVREEKIVEKPVIEETTTIHCDKCGREVSDEIGDTQDDDLYPQTLEVALNKTSVCAKERSAGTTAGPVSSPSGIASAN